MTIRVRLRRAVAVTVEDVEVPKGDALLESMEPLRESGRREDSAENLVGPQIRTCLVCAFREHLYVDLCGSADPSFDESVRVPSPRVFGASLDVRVVVGM